MAKKPLRSQLNQIRAWVRQGRTDAWIAHQLDVSASELREFRRRHELSAEGEDMGEIELRDEIEAEIEALSDTAEEEAADDEEEGEAEAEGEEAGEKREGEGSGRRRRRRRRRGRGGGGDRAGAAMQATFDHGETDGYGLWLDPAVSDDPIYAEHWAGHRKVEVTIEPDRIVVKRV